MGGRGSAGRGGGGRVSLPALQGSERQVSWANDIRETAYSALDGLDRTLDRIERDVRRGSLAEGRTNAQIQRTAEDMAGFSRQSIRTVRAELNDTLSTVTSARTIIDQRDNLSANRIVNLVRLEEGTGQVSAARRRRGQR